MTNEELVQVIQAGERGRLPELWDQVQRLARFWANKYTRTIVAGGKSCDPRELAEDLFQCGYIAMAAAVETYSGESHSAFSTWYGFYYRREVRSMMGWRSVKDPATGKYTTINPDAMDHAVSLDVPLSGDDGDPNAGTLEDVTPDPVDHYEDSDRDMWITQLRAALDPMICGLPTECQKVLWLRYYRGLTYADAARKLGITDAEARRMESRSLRELRRPQNSMVLRPFCRA